MPRFGDQLEHLLRLQDEKAAQLQTEIENTRRAADMRLPALPPYSPVWQSSAAADLVRELNEFGEREDVYKAWNKTGSKQIDPRSLVLPIELISSHVFTEDTPTYSLDIPARYKHLLVTGIGRSTNTPATPQEQSVNFHFNDDSGANYQWSYCGVRSGVNVVAETNPDTGLPFGMFNSDNCDAGSASSFFCFIPHYTGGFWKMALSIIAGQKTITAAGTESTLFTGFWKNTSPIEKISLDVGAFDLKSGSLVAVYGWL